MSAALVMLLVDAFGIAWNAAAQAPLSTKLGMFLQICAFFSGFAAVAALAFGTLTGAVQRSLRPLWAGLERADAFEPRDLVLTGLPLLALSSFGLYAAILEAPKRFRNAELSALLIALGMASLTLSLFWLALLLARWSHRTRRRSRTVHWVACVLPAALASAGPWSLMLWDNRSGLVQLNRWLLGGVVSALLTYFVAARFWHGRPPITQSVKRKYAALFVATVGSLCGVFLPWPIVSVVARSQGVAPLFVVALRTATDFDRDGYSSLLMGGDCAPFDPNVHPGAPEIPRDNIDNNCVGGDSTGIPKSKPPRWHARPAEVPSKLNVLLITVDTVRADRVSFLGHHQRTTPNLDAYAARAYVFERFFATTPWTRLTVASMFSSRPPTRVHWQKGKKRPAVLAPDNPWVPSLFQRAGYETIAVLNSFEAFTDREELGFDRGFGTYDTSTRVRYQGGTMRGFPGQEQLKVARRHLRRSRKQPFFMWVHLLEPHYLYERSPRAPNFGADKQGLYASEIWEADAVVGSLLEEVKQQGLEDTTLVMVVGDHGEEFQEHGRNWHGGNLYQTQVHTIGLVHVPGLPGGRIREAVSHEDIGPTLLNLAGLRGGFATLAGRNLTGLLSRGERLPRAHFFLERELRHGKDYMAALVHYPHKLIYNADGRSFEFFDLSRDPGETSSLPLVGEPYTTFERMMRMHLEGARP